MNDRELFWSGSVGMVQLAWKHLENIPDFGWEAAAASLKGGPRRGDGEGARRRTLGPVPQLQVAQDPFNHRAVADQADDLKGAGAAGKPENPLSTPS